MKALAIAVSAFALILLFWAVVLIGITANAFPRADFSNLPVFELIKTTCAIITTGIAFYALKTWRRTLKAQKRTEFLDQLMTAVLEYISAIRRPIDLIMVMNIEIEELRFGRIDRDESRMTAVIEMISHRGRSYTESLNKALKECDPSLAKLGSLVTKGQVFQFVNYGVCMAACSELERLHGRILAMGTVMDTDFLNDERFDLVAKIFSLTDKEIEAVVGAQKISLIEYVRDRYSEMHD